MPLRQHLDHDVLVIRSGILEQRVSGLQNAEFASGSWLNGERNPNALRDHPTRGLGELKVRPNCSGWKTRYRCIQKASQVWAEIGNRVDAELKILGEITLRKQFERIARSKAELQWHRLVILSLVQVFEYARCAHAPAHAHG